MKGPPAAHRSVPASVPGLNKSCQCLPPGKVDWVHDTMAQSDTITADEKFARTGVPMFNGTLRDAGPFHTRRTCPPASS
jgi:hypothetical protein